MTEFRYTASYERPGTPPRPSDDAVATSVARLRFALTSMPQLEDLLDAFRAQYSNGGAMAAQFSIRNTDDTYRWFAQVDRLEARHGYDLAGRLLDSDDFHRALPEIDPPGMLGAQPLRDLVFERVHPLEFEGRLAASLSDGGVYGANRITAAQAKRLAASASDEVIGERYESFTVVNIVGSWAQWFSGLLASTWVLIDRERDTVTVICTSDSD